MKLGTAAFVLLSFCSLNASADLFKEHDVDVVPMRTLADLRVDQNMAMRSIPVANCGNDLNEVMLRIKDAPLKISGAGVTYDDNTNNTISFNRTFNADYDSPWIDLDYIRRAGKCVKTFFVNAASTDPRVRSHVTVFGR